MKQPKTEILCLLSRHDNEDGSYTYAVSAPDALYGLVDTETLPDDWEYVADTISKVTGDDVLGAITRTEMPDLDMDDASTDEQPQS